MESFYLFTGDMSSALELASADDERIDKVSHVLKDYLLRPDFMHDCIERCLMAMQNGRSRWRNPQIAEDVDAGYLMRMLFWPAGFIGDIHRHNYWTVTGVMYNSIDIIVYDSDGTQESHRYKGCAGAVGKVLPPCTHAAANLSEVPSVTLAVFCRVPKSQQQGDEVEWVTATQEGRYTAGIYDRALRAFIFMINANPTARSLYLLDHIYTLAKPSMKLLAAKAMARQDPFLALRRLEEIYHYLDDPDQRSQVAQVTASLRKAVYA